MSKILNKRTLFIVLTILVLLIAAFFIVPVSIPLLLAVLTALLINPAVEWYEHRFNWERKYAVSFVFIGILAILIILFYYTVTTVFGKLIELTRNLPDYFNKLAAVWNELELKLIQYTEGMPQEVVTAIQLELSAIFDSMRDAVIHFLNYDTIMGLITNIPNFLVSVIVYLIALFLFMLELPNLKGSFFNYLTDETKRKVLFLTQRLNNVFLGFIKAQFLVSLIIFAVTFIGLLFIKPHYALIMALVIWIIDLIPIIGSIVVVGPWSLYYFIAGDPVTGTKLAILAIILLVIRRTVEPKVMGTHIGLKPLPTLIAMFIGLKLFGFLGFFIGPVIVILFTTAKEVGLIKFPLKI